MSASTVVGERGLRAPLPFVLAGALALSFSLVGCGDADGSAAALGSIGVDASRVPGSPAGAGPETDQTGGSAGTSAGVFGRLAGVELEVAPYPVADALAAEGGDAMGSMLRVLSIGASEVELTLAVAPGGDPTISDWKLPGATAEDILEAWSTAAPGSWTTTALAGTPARAGAGLDGSSAWALAVDGRFVYIRTDDRAVAEEAAAAILP